MFFTKKSINSLIFKFFCTILSVFSIVLTFLQLFQSSFLIFLSQIIFLILFLILILYYKETRRLYGYHRTIVGLRLVYSHYFSFSLLHHIKTPRINVRIRIHPIQSMISIGIPEIHALAAMAIIAQPSPHSV